MKLSTNECRKTRNNKRILIVGDSCMDVFTYCKGIKLAPDFPVPIVNIVRKVESPEWL